MQMSVEVPKDNEDKSEVCVVLGCDLVVKFVCFRIWMLPMMCFAQLQ